MRRPFALGLSALALLAVYQTVTGNGFGTEGGAAGKVRPLFGGESQCVRIHADVAGIAALPAACNEPDAIPETEGAAGEFGGTGGGVSLSFEEVKRLWIQHGGDPGQANVAAAVATAESGRRPGATNASNTNGTIDRGLFQMNSIHGGCSTYDLDENVRCAVKLSRNGSYWKPWVAFNTKAYLKYL
jgi:hypothetical protein